VAFFLGKTIEEIEEISYEELQGWFEYFERRPIGWREDNRAAIIAMSLGGSDKVKPEDLFASLKVIKNANSEGGTIAEKFVERFSSRFSEQPEFLNVQPQNNLYKD
jgi:hypothetical protein